MVPLKLSQLLTWGGLDLPEPYYISFESNTEIDLCFPNFNTMYKWVYDPEKNSWESKRGTLTKTPSTTTEAIRIFKQTRPNESEEFQLWKNHNN